MPPARPPDMPRASVSQHEGALEALLDRQTLLAERYRAVINQLDDAVVVTDGFGGIEVMNTAAERLFGYVEAEVVGRNVRRLLEPDSGMSEADVEPLSRAAGGADAAAHEVRARRKDGRTVALILDVRRLSPGGGFLLGANTRSTAGENERRARRARMQGIAQVAAGIAHELNNILQVFLGNAPLLAKDLDRVPAAAPLLEAILAACRRGSALSKSLLALSNRQLLDPSDTDINGVLAEIERLAFDIVPDSVNLICWRQTGLSRARIDAGQLETAMLSLLLNALDAMPTGGRIEIEANNATIDSAAADQLEIAAGAYVRIKVRDDGTGMPADVARRAFEPFFTTKGVGKGSGVGLASVFGFARQSGGHACIRSEEGIGTVVELLLPAAPAAGAAIDQGA